MKMLCFIPLCFLVPVNAEQRPISEVPDYNQSFDEKLQLVEKGTTVVTGSCTIEKNIFYSASGTFYTTVKLGDCDTKLKAELISSSSNAVFNQCVIKPNCSSSTNLDGLSSIIPVWNPFFSPSEVRGPLLSDYINWGCNFPVSGLPFRRNWLGFVFTNNPNSPSFFESLINSGIIGNPTLCLAVKSSCNFAKEDKAAGKLLFGKNIPEVFPKSYAKFDSHPVRWSLQLTAASICDEDILASSAEIDIDTSTPYIVMNKNNYINFLNKLQNDFGIKCLDDGPTNEGEIDVCYVECEIANKLPRIGLTLSSHSGAAPAVEYFLKNNLVKFGGEAGGGRCSLAIAGRTLTSTAAWRLGTSFFNGRTVCFESTSGVKSISIGSSGL